MTSRDHRIWTEGARFTRRGFMSSGFAIAAIVQRRVNEAASLYPGARIVRPLKNC